MAANRWLSQALRLMLWMVASKAVIMEASPLVEKMSARANPKESKPPRGRIMMSVTVPSMVAKVVSGTKS